MSADWYQQAACRGLPTEWWYPERGDNALHALATSICATCPVIDSCRDVAKANGERHGVWAGVSVGKQPKRYRAKVAVCGTTGGYYKHKRLAEQPCDPCRTAHSDYQRARHQLRKAQRRGAA